MCWVLHEVRLGFIAGMVGVCLPAGRLCLLQSISLLRAKLWLWDRHRHTGMCALDQLCKGVVQKEGCMGKERLSVLLLYKTFPCWDLLPPWGQW